MQTFLYCHHFEEIYLSKQSIISNSYIQSMLHLKSVCFSKSNPQKSAMRLPNISVFFLMTLALNSNPISAFWNNENPCHFSIIQILRVGFWSYLLMSPAPSHSTQQPPLKGGGWNLYDPIWKGGWTDSGAAMLLDIEIDDILSQAYYPQSTSLRGR